jgi:transposase
VPRPRTAMHKIRELLRLTYGEGLSRRQVSLSTGIPVTTISEHLGRARLAGLSWPLPDAMDDAALEAALFPPRPPSTFRRPMPDFAYVHKELKRKGVTLQLLWLEYREVHTDGLGYSQFCNHYVTWRKHVDVVMRQNHRAGEKMFVDFPGVTIPIYERNSRALAFEAQLFVACLGASSYTYAEALRSQELVHFVAGHVHALEFFGGAPQISVCDNLRSAVTKAHRYEPEINRTYDEFAEHYSMAVIPARPYKARDKAKVEAAVLMAERWIIAVLRNRRFYSLAEANLAISECVKALNARPFKKMDGSRRDLFETLDRPALRRLPPERYSFGAWRRATVNIDYHVESDKHWYSVPYQLVGEEVWVRTSSSAVEVFYRSRRVASHVRSFVRHKYSTDESHMPEAHRRHAQWTPSRLVAWAEKTGPGTALLVAGILERRRHPEQGYRSVLGIMRLAKRHGEERAEAACARALHMGAYSYRSVESILAHNLDREPLPADHFTAPHPHHRNVRGSKYYR